MRNLNFYSTKENKKMNMWFSLLTSLLLTTVVGFAIPLLFCSLGLSVLALMAHLPEIATFGKICYEEVLSFFVMFGNGSASEGIVIIALTGGFVAFLFESLNFYRYRLLINQPITHSNLNSK